MSATTGRMSRADAARTLEQLQPAIREFSSPDASPATLSEAASCEAARAEIQYQMDAGYGPHARAIRDLRTRVAALQAERLANSLQTAPRTTAAAVVTLYGLQADDSRRAAGLAAQHLALPSADDVRLQDASHVRTATLTGTRYIFTSHTP